MKNIKKKYELKDTETEIVHKKDLYNMVANLVKQYHMYYEQFPAFNKKFLGDKIADILSSIIDDIVKMYFEKTKFNSQEVFFKLKNVEIHLNIMQKCKIINTKQKSVLGKLIANLLIALKNVKDNELC